MEAQTKTAKNGTHKDVYTTVNDDIIALMNQGIVPWQQHWTDAGIPTNLFSKRPFRGINVMLLSAYDYRRNLFITTKRLNELGGSILPDARSHRVVAWNYPAKETDAAKSATVAEYSVYNVSQCTGIPQEFITPVVKPDPMEFCHKIIAGMPNCPKIRQKENKAYYDPREDVINMPKQKSFETDADYYSTLFHQLIHSTGHHTRLGRMALVQMSEFGWPRHSQEELIAEICTCYFESLTGIATAFDGSKEYIEGWVSLFKKDSHFIFTAFSLAQKALDYVFDCLSEADAKKIQEDAVTI